MTWFTNEIIYTGSYFSCVFSFNVDEVNRMSLELDMNDREELY